MGARVGRVLGIDPGFASFGWAAMTLDGDGEHVDVVGVWRTAKDKRKVLTTVDNHRRACELAELLDAAIQVNESSVICAESVSFVRSSSVMCQIGSVWGIIAAASVRYGIPVVLATPQQIKKATTGKTSATKDEVQASIVARYPGVAGHLEGIRAKGMHEHAVDAVGAVVACLRDPAVMMARRQAA